MRRVQLAYRDDDRTPVIFCIKEMAERYYDVEVEVVQIRGTPEFEAALFDGSCDVIIEHWEYLYGDPSAARHVSLFCAPILENHQDLVVPAHVNAPADLAGHTLAVRPHGRPHNVTLRLRAMGLEQDVQRVLVADEDVGRWGQWKKVVAGECIGAFMSPLYLPAALEAGLKVLPTPELPLVGHYAQACLTVFATANDDLLLDYVKGVIHALCLLKLRRAEALAIVREEPMRRMRIADPQELERQFDAIAQPLQLRPYPTAEAIANTFELAVDEYGADPALNPLAMWDLHWVKRLDDEGFIDARIADMRG